MCIRTGYFNISKGNKMKKFFIVGFNAIPSMAVYFLFTSIAGGIIALSLPNLLSHLQTKQSIFYDTVSLIVGLSVAYHSQTFDSELVKIELSEEE